MLWWRFKQSKLGMFWVLISIPEGDMWLKPWAIWSVLIWFKTSVVYICPQHCPWDNFQLQHEKAPEEREWRLGGGVKLCCYHRWTWGWSFTQLQSLSLEFWGPVRVPLWGSFCDTADRVDNLIAPTSISFQALVRTVGVTEEGDDDHAFVSMPTWIICPR